MSKRPPIKAASMNFVDSELICFSLDHQTLLLSLSLSSKACCTFIFSRSRSKHAFFRLFVIFSTSVRLIICLLYLIF